MSSSADQLDQLDVENFFKMVEKNIGVDLGLGKILIQLSSSIAQRTKYPPQTIQKDKT